MAQTTAPGGVTILADVGGTNTRVARAEGGRLRSESIRRYANRGQPGLEPILMRYMAEERVESAREICVAAAGPVRGGRVSLTNIDWVIAPETICGATGAARAVVLNDLQAQGHALGHLGPNACRPVIGRITGTERDAKLVIGIGTGFNVAPVQETVRGRVVSPSETGHISLPVRDEAGLRLARALAGEDGFAAVEDALSGRGVSAVHRYLHGADGLRGEEITSAADRGESHALETLRTLVRLLAMVAGDQALVHLPFGGIYLCGSVARELAPHLEPLGFTEFFRDKGRFSEMMASFPVAVIEDDFAALAGCAAYLSGAAL